MTARYLLDTNILSNLIREPHGIIARRIAQVGELDVCTSIIVAAELRYGVAKKQSKRLSASLDAILEALEVLPLETPFDEMYGAIRAKLERKGEFVGPSDLIVAAQALSLGLILVTDNVREFSRVEDLTIQNWLRG